MGDVVRVNGHKFVTFDLAIVPEEVFIDNPVCPHCDSPNDFHEVDYPTTRFTSAIINECVDCSQMILVVDLPKLPSIKKPIMTRWTVEDGYDVEER